MCVRRLRIKIDVKHDLMNYYEAAVTRRRVSLSSHVAGCYIFRRTYACDHVRLINNVNGSTHIFQ